MRAALLLLSAIATTAGSAVAQDGGPAPVLPDTVPFETVPQVPGLESKWLVGTGADSSLYLLRVRLAPGTRLPPHTHPDSRFTQVLSGTLYVGFGRTFDTTAVRSIPAGAVFVTPAGTPHFVWARDGDVEYQESGEGPTANQFVEAPSP